MPKPQRTIPRSLRFTVEEWASIEAALGDADFSAWARSRLLGLDLAQAPQRKKRERKEIIRRGMTEFQAEKCRQLAWIGNNLNQLARAANQGTGGLYLTYALARLEREIKELANNAR